MNRQLSFPAPRRCSHELPGGGYYTAPWTAYDVIDYKLAGGWFKKGSHDFANGAAAKAAGVRDD